MFHGPMLQKSNDIEFVGVWARRPEAAALVTKNYGGIVFESFDELTESCEALAFCVPPDIQATMATTAAQRGLHLLLEKPLALDLPSARNLVEAIELAGVTSQLVLTNRYRLDARAFITQAHQIEPLGASVTWISNAAIPGEPFATPWRIERGALPDIGPHALDLLDAALGPITGIDAIGNSTTVVTLICKHESGAQSTAVLTAVAHEHAAEMRFEVFGTKGAASFGAGNTQPTETGDVLEMVTSEFVGAVRSGQPHPLDARRGLMLQTLLDEAATALAK